MEYHRSFAQQHILHSHNLNEWFVSPTLESNFHDRVQHLQQLINDAKASHRLLTLSSEHWTQFQDLASQVDQWLKKANVQLQKMINKAEREKLSQDDCFQYWVMKADAEEKQQDWDQAKSQLDRAVALISIMEEEAGRQFCLSVDESWINLSHKLHLVEQLLLQGLAQQTDVPLDDRITCIECSHARIQAVLDQLPIVYSSPDQAMARRRELEVSGSFLKKFN